jgi:hypothetical protein
MEQRLISLLTFIQKNNQNKQKTVFEDLISSFGKEEARNGYYQLITLGFITQTFDVTQSGALELLNIEEEKRETKAVMKEQRVLIIKQQSFIDKQLKDYTLYKRLTIGAFIVSLISIFWIVVGKLIL